MRRRGGQVQRLMSGRPPRPNNNIRPISSCSTDSAYSAVVSKANNRRPLPRYNNNAGKEAVYSTFRPEVANASTATEEEEDEEDEVEKKVDEKAVITESSGKVEEQLQEQEQEQGVSDFAQEVSADMNELVFHLNSIQNDISELAGRPISINEQQQT